MNRVEKRRPQIRQPQYSPVVIRKMNGTDFGNMAQQYKKRRTHLDIAYVEKMRLKREIKERDDKFYFK